MNKRSVGSIYEQLAAEQLINMGYSVLACNYRNRFGEIDIIAKDGDTICFCEVKYRRDNGNYLLAHFEPKCDMIPVVMWHFVDRYPGENFVIYDDRRRYAVVHPRLKECFYINESEFKQLEISVPVKTDSFEQLWKVYFEHTDIRERFNPQCQRNLCPKWYRKNMVEFT